MQYLLLSNPLKFQFSKWPVSNKDAASNPEQKQWKKPTTSLIAVVHLTFGGQTLAPQGHF